eukprot:206569-Hanusia_phi.AAC.1
MMRLLPRSHSGCPGGNNKYHRSGCYYSKAFNYTTPSGFAQLSSYGTVPQLRGYNVGHGYYYRVAALEDSMISDNPPSYQAPTPWPRAIVTDWTTPTVTHSPAPPHRTTPLFPKVSNRSDSVRSVLPGILLETFQQSSVPSSGPPLRAVPPSNPTPPPPLNPNILLRTHPGHPPGTVTF